MDEYSGKRVTVMGLGRFGGGVGVIRWLAEQGADVLVTDLDAAERLGSSLESIGDLVQSGAVTLRLGGHNVADFTDTDVVIANPAVPRPWENRFLRAATAAGIQITTEIRLGLEQIDPEGFAARPRGSEMHVVGVTGTAGKSTTASMIHHALRRLGVRTELAGNIGRSLLDPALLRASPRVLVLEISSAQLWWLRQDSGYPGAMPYGVHTAVVTGFAPNHLDWHGDMEHYRLCKQQILRGTLSYSRPGSILLGPSVADWSETVPQHSFARIAMPSACQTDDRHLIVEEGAIDSLGCVRAPGRHNRMNALLATLAARIATDCSYDFGPVYEAAGSFPGLAHRLQFVGEFGGVRVYNDSKSTTPEGVALAIEAFAEEGASKIHLICGGYDKGVDLAPMVRAAAGCGFVATIGTTGEALAERISMAGGRSEFVGTLEAAVGRIRGLVGRGDIVLLSPGCASWDHFIHYEERGERFMELVRAALTDGH